MCAGPSQCDLHSFLWLPWQQKCFSHTWSVILFFCFCLQSCFTHFTCTGFGADKVLCVHETILLLIPQYLLVYIHTSQILAVANICFFILTSAMQLLTNQYVEYSSVLSFSFFCHYLLPPFIFVLYLPIPSVFVFRLCEALFGQNTSILRIPVYVIKHTTWHIS